jgi:hypothetical protein
MNALAPSTFDRARRYVARIGVATKTHAASHVMAALKSHPRT